MGAAFFVCLHIFVADVQIASLPLRVHLLSHFQTRVVFLLPPPLVSEGGPNTLLVIPHLRRRFGTSSFFLVIFNYRSHSPVTGRPTTSALAWFIQKLAGHFRRLYESFIVFLFFFLSLLLQKLASCSLFNLDLPYHVTYARQIFWLDLLYYFLIA